jgi:hypothetical protein
MISVSDGLKISCSIFDFAKFHKQMTKSLPALRRAGREVVLKFFKILRKNGAAYAIGMPSAFPSNYLGVCATDFPGHKHLIYLQQESLFAIYY